MVSIGRAFKAACKAKKDAFSDFYSSFVLLSRFAKKISYIVNVHIT